MWPNGPADPKTTNYDWIKEVKLTYSLSETPWSCQSGAFVLGCSCCWGGVTGTGSPQSPQSQLKREKSSYSMQKTCATQRGVRKLTWNCRKKLWDATFKMWETLSLWTTEKISGGLLITEANCFTGRFPVVSLTYCSFKKSVNFLLNLFVLTVAQ